VEHFGGFRDLVGEPVVATTASFGGAIRGTRGVSKIRPPNVSSTGTLGVSRALRAPGSLEVSRTGALGVSRTGALGVSRTGALGVSRTGALGVSRTEVLAVSRLGWNIGDISDRVRGEDFGHAADDPPTVPPVTNGLQFADIPPDVPIPN